MIDIDKWEARMTHRDDEPLLPPSPEEVLALIAEIRRLRGTREHRKCPCGGEPIRHGGERPNQSPSAIYWIECRQCEWSTENFDTTEKAWAAWDGAE